MKKEKCVVTGGNGYIGSHVVDVLRKANYDVKVLDIVGECINVDICNLSSLLEIFEQEKPDYVYHIAAIANARTALENPIKAVEININGTANILEASRQNNVKRVI